jgi:hypothetical protein
MMQVWAWCRFGSTDLCLRALRAVRGERGVSDWLTSLAAGGGLYPAISQTRSLHKAAENETPNKPLIAHSYNEDLATSHVRGIWHVVMSELIVVSGR